jgi:hypothetical protein
MQFVMGVKNWMRCACPVRFISHGSMRLREIATEKGLASGKEELNSEKES